MTSPESENRNASKIVELPCVEDRAKAADLARYWDATVSGQPAAPGALDQEMIAVVQLLRHYHGLARHDQSQQGTTCLHASIRHGDHTAITGSPPTPRPIERGEWNEPPLAMTRAAICLMALFVVLFAINTVTSPRSWLVTENDPDWIPWVSDDWIAAVWESI